jgi:hypothetical protein
MHLPNDDNVNTEYWDLRQDKIVTNIGKWEGGNDVIIRGYSLFNDLFDKVSYFQILALNATGKLISAELSRWIENSFMVMSYPDARIWCNQVGALSGTMGVSPSAATAAGSLSADSRIYGTSKSQYVAMTFIGCSLSDFKKGVSVETLIGKLPIKQGMPAAPGFVRPVAKDDERIAPFRKMTARLGFESGEHLTLADKISSFMEERYSTSINIGGFFAAFLMDQGFSPMDAYKLYCLAVSSGVTACHSDNLQHPENSFLPLRCDQIEYTGHKIRSVDG